MIPNDDQIRADAEYLGYSERNTARLLTHARRARTGSTAVDGFKSTHGASGGVGSDSGSAVERSVLTAGDGYDDDGKPESKAESFRSTRPAGIERQHALLWDMFQQSVVSKRATMNTMDRLDEMQRFEKPVGQTSKPCCTKGCDGESVARGRCDPCRKWQERNPYDDGTYREIPPEVVAERTRRKAKAS